MTKALETLGLLIFIVTSKLWQRLWKSWALEMQDVFFSKEVFSITSSVVVGSLIKRR
jgi:hypothetical protein